MDRDSLMAAMRVTASVKPRPVDVPGWGTVYVRALTVAEVEEQTADLDKKDDKSRIARGAARLLCDESGTRMFEPSNGEHVDLLAAQPWELLRKVIDASNQQIEGEAGKASGASS